MLINFDGIHGSPELGHPALGLLNGKLGISPFFVTAHSPAAIALEKGGAMRGKAIGLADSVPSS